MITAESEYLAECLRAELGDYGGLLNLFEQQQQHIFDRNAEAVLRLASEIEQHSDRLAHCRTRREVAVAEFARQHRCSPASSLRSLLPHVEADARPLLEALINEVNTLLYRVRRVHRHNQSLLSRAVDVHQDILQFLRPNSLTKTYSPGGRVSVTAGRVPSTLRVAG